MTYIALVRKHSHETYCQVRPRSLVAELVELAQPGDSMHEVPATLVETVATREYNTGPLLELVNEQLATGQCTVIGQ